MPAGQRGFQRVARGCVFDQLDQLGGDFLGRGVFLFEESRGAGFRSGPGVAELVIVRRVRERHEQRRHAHGRQFRERRGPGATDRGARRAQRQIHLREEWVRRGFHAERRVSLLHLVRVVRAGQVQPLPVRRALGEQWQRGEHQVVDAARALTAAHHKQDRPRRIESKREAASHGIAGVKIRTHRRARHCGFAHAQPCGRRRKPDESLVNEVCDPAIGAAGNRVGLVQKSFCAGLLRRENRRRAGEAAHRQHGARRP